MAGIALVLGAGGTVGHAFHAGVLAALADVRWLGCPPRRPRRRHLGWFGRRRPAARRPAADRPPQAWQPAAAVGGGRGGRAHGAGLGRPCPRPPRPRPSSRSMPLPRTRLARAARAPWAVTPGSLGAALLPAGELATGDMAVPFDNLFGDSLAERVRRGSWPSSSTPAGASRPAAAVLTGRRRRRRAGLPRHPASQPEPAVIDGERYVDGGVHSTTNADLVGGERPDLVLVSAPMSAARGAARPPRSDDGGASLRRPLPRPRGVRPAWPPASPS